jgi:hypothetical protein
MKNIINVEHVIDDENQSFRIAPIKGFWSFGLFRDKHYEEYDFPALFFGRFRPMTIYFIEKITQENLINLN